MSNNVNQGRLLSLDILRGMTIVGMLMVNNPGSWSFVYAPLKHAEWNGLTPTDLIFPFFMFIMGISTYFSLSKSNFHYNSALLYKICKRTVVIFFLGVFISWFALGLYSFYGSSMQQIDSWPRFLQSFLKFDQLRILGVLQRLALCYCATALIGILINHKWIPLIVTFLLIFYFVLLIFGNGFEFSENNIVSIIDRTILGEKHLYHDNNVALDPEGLLSTIPSIAHVLIGFYCAKFLVIQTNKVEQSLLLFVIGTIFMFAGFLFSYACPINKKIWSPTFVLVTCGLAAILLAFLVWLIDIKGKKDWSVFFESFGINPLFIYVLGSLLSVLITSINFSFYGEKTTINGFVFQKILQPLLGNYAASLGTAILFLFVVWLFAHVLYRKNIYIKI